jgi:hypothetical protein
MLKTDIKIRTFNAGFKWYHYLQKVISNLKI